MPREGAWGVKSWSVDARLQSRQHLATQSELIRLRIGVCEFMPYTCTYFFSFNHVLGRLRKINHNKSHFGDK